MKGVRLSPILFVAILAGLSACEKSTAVVPTLLTDSTLAADVATTSGDALAAGIENMIGNELAGSLSNLEASPMSNLTTSAPTVVRTRTCFDANGVAVANCLPLTSVRKIVTHVTVDGSRSRTDTVKGNTRTFTGAVHRISNDTVVRNFNAATTPVEVSRTHSDLTTAHDTTTFTEGDVTRVVRESAIDSVKAVTFALPHLTNPFPISGSIARVDTVSMILTKGTHTESRQAVRTMRVTFPPDAQGNVVLTINGKTCNLNLVTHAVTGCL
jgi:hypothetical protein